MAAVVIEEWQTVDESQFVREWNRSAIGRTLWPGFGERPMSPVCPICQPLDGQRFRRGEGPPIPLHPYCRCRRVPVAVYDPDTMPADELLRLGAELEQGMRVARRVLPAGYLDAIGKTRP